MKSLVEFINEASILSDIEDTIKTGATTVKNALYDNACKAIEKFIMDNYRLTYERSFKSGKITVRKKPNKDGKWIVDCKSANDVQLKPSAKTLTNDIFVWGKVRNFEIQENNNITSLDGCPEEVENFSVMRNNKLMSLDGMPNVTRYFNFGYNAVKVTKEELEKLSGAPNVTIWDKN